MDQKGSISNDMSLRDTVTFKSFDTECLVAYFIPKENTQPESYRYFTNLNPDLLPGMLSLSNNNTDQKLCNFDTTLPNFKFINKHFKNFAPCGKAK